VKNLAELQAECGALGIKVETKGRASKEPYIAALRDYHWRKDHGDQPLPPQTMPMLLANWEDLDEAEAAEIEADGSGWLVQQKLDGVRALLHVERDGVRITSRTVSEVNYRLSEFQANIPHVAEGFEPLAGTILDGELICPLAAIDTGATRTENALQATMAILATTPANAQKIQVDQESRLVFHAFDILKLQGADATQQPLLDRLDLLHRAVRIAQNPHVAEVPGHVIGKAGIHQNLLATGEEGSVWKKLDGCYQPGQRVRHWVKRKRGLFVTAFVSDFKPGTPGRGNGELVGAVEFSCRQADGTVSPIGWISSWADAERRAMTTIDAAGRVGLNSEYLQKKAIITGQDLSARSRRLRHARLVCWLDA
jgi:ATP-dependent DNA ligase